MTDLLLSFCRALPRALASRALTRRLPVVLMAVLVPAIFGQNFQLNWSDRRAIGNLFVASCNVANSSNPRAYFFDGYVDPVNNPAGFRTAALAWADKSVQILKNMNAQGAIVWDIEGARVCPDWIVYNGSPDLLPAIAPDMNAIADEFINKFKAAGLKIGVTLRPQRLVVDSNNVPISQQALSSDSEIANLLISKINYARNRWGASIFYIDSNANPNGSAMSPAVFQTVYNAFPSGSILIIPELHWDISSLGYWAVSAPYVDMNNIGKCSSVCSYVQTPSEIKSTYPGAFSILNAHTGNISANYSQLVQAVKNGDILLFHGWYDDQPVNGYVKQIYADAGVYNPGTMPSVSITAPANGATVSGTVNVNTNTNSSVTKVEFLVDGAVIQTDSSAPFTFGWNTTTTANGSHTLMAKAYDSAGNSASGSVTVTVSNSGTTPPISSGTLINSGGGFYTDKAGQSWSADASFTGGYTATTTTAIGNTADPALYQSERFGTFDYNVSVPNGTYNVTLKFAEIYYTTAGKRVFSVALNGKTVLSNFDVVAQAGGAFKAIDKTFPVSVTNGSINVHMIPVVENPKISAIQIAPAAASAVRVNVGGPLYNDPSGQAWSADFGFSGGTVSSSTAPVQNTSTPALYQTNRYGALTYRLTVPSGTRTVTLKFAETYFGQSGQRLFNILLNGQNVESNLDVFVAAGGKNVALDKTYSVSAPNGTVEVTLQPVRENPFVSAIEIK